MNPDPGPMQTLLRQNHLARQRAEEARNREIDLLNADPFDMVGFVPRTFPPTTNKNRCFLGVVYVSARRANETCSSCLLTYTSWGTYIVCAGVVSVRRRRRRKRSRRP